MGRSRFPVFLLAVVAAAWQPGCGNGSGGSQGSGASCTPGAPASEYDARHTWRAAPGCKYGPGAMPSRTIGCYLDNFQQVPRVIGDAMPIQYVFVLMMENRSFDNYFGRFADYLDSEDRDTQWAIRGTAPDPTNLRTRPFAGQENPYGVDVPGTPVDLLDPDLLGAALTDLRPKASSTDFEATGDADAPYNPAVAGTPPAGTCQKHFWHHAGDKLDPSLGWRYQRGPTLAATIAANFLSADQCVADTCHEWWCSHMQWNHGAMDGFYQSNDGYWEGSEPNTGYPPEAPLLGGDRAMIYYDWTDVPLYYWLADNFGIADRYYAAMLGPTWPNRDYMYGATSRGATSNSTNQYDATLPTTSGNFAKNYVPNPEPIAPNGKPIQTIYDDLAYGGSQGVTFTHWVRERYSSYRYTLADGAVRYGAWYGTGSPTNPPVSADQPCVAASWRDYSLLAPRIAAENDMLLSGTIPLHPECSIPAVNFIDPDATEDVNAEDEHPPGTPQMGQRLSWNLLQTLMANREVWKRSVVFITYDEHGGFYDHVPPPAACAPDNLKPVWTGAYGGGPKTTSAGSAGARTVDGKPDNTDAAYGGDFTQYGVRVPLMVVSPWAKHGKVSHYTYDHTSILRFIEARYSLPAITARDANADPLLDFFDFSQASDKLAGKVAGWGTEQMPDASGPRYAGLASLDGANGTANMKCLANFPPSSSPGPGVYGANQYDALDWSVGRPPPCHHDPNDPHDHGCAKFTVKDLGPISTASSEQTGIGTPGLFGASGWIPAALNATGVVTIDAEGNMGAAQPQVVSGTSTKNLSLYPNATFGLSLAINDSGIVAGVSSTGIMGSLTFPAGLATLWVPTPGASSGYRMVPLGALPGGPKGLAPWASSAAFGVNNLGHAVGASMVPAPMSAGTTAVSHAFFYDGTTIHDLGIRSGDQYSAAYAIDDHDEIVGVCGASPSVGMSTQVPCVWRAGQPVAVLPTAEIGGQAVAVNAQGWVAVNGTLAWVVTNAFGTKTVTSYRLHPETPRTQAKFTNTLLDDDAIDTQAAAMGQEFLPKDPTPRFDSVVGAQICQAGDVLQRPTYTAAHWTSARNTAATVSGPAFVVENLNSVITSDVPAFLDYGLAENAWGAILATGYPVARGQPFPATLPPHHLYLLQPIGGPTPPTPPAPTNPKPAAVVGTFRASYKANFASSVGGMYTPTVQATYGMCDFVILPDDQIEVCGGMGTIAVDGSFSTYDGTLSISGKLAPDPATGAVSATIPPLKYSWVFVPPQTDAGTLTLQ